MLGPQSQPDEPLAKGKTLQRAARKPSGEEPPQRGTMRRRQQRRSEQRMFRMQSLRNHAAVGEAMPSPSGMVARPGQPGPMGSLAIQRTRPKPSHHRSLSGMISNGPGGGEHLNTSDQRQPRRSPLRKGRRWRLQPVHTHASSLPAEANPTRDQQDSARSSRPRASAETQEGMSDTKKGERTPLKKKFTGPIRTRRIDQAALALVNLSRVDRLPAEQ